MNAVQLEKYNIESLLVCDTSVRRILKADERGGGGGTPTFFSGAPSTSIEWVGVHVYHPSTGVTTKKKKKIVAKGGGGGRGLNPLNPPPPLRTRLVCDHIHV